MRDCDRLAGCVQEEQAGQLRLRIYFYCQLYLWKMGSHQHFECFLFIAAIERAACKRECVTSLGAAL